MTKKELIEHLRKTLPVMWERIRTDELTGGVIKARRLANLSCQDKGPGGTFRCGRKVVMTREAFLEWLAGSIEEL